MGVTDILVEEHRIIERVLDALETAAQRLEAGEALDPSFFILASDFIKGFADGCHHKKEEGILFPAMSAAGIPSEGGPVGVMLAEHDQGREFTALMRAAGAKLQAGDAAARGEVVQAARNYAFLLRHHIAKENEILFPMAESVIGGSYLTRVIAAFENIEREEAGEGAHGRFLALAETLERQAEG